MVTTFPRAVGAVFWAALFWVSSEMMKPLFETIEQSSSPRLFSELNAAYGLVVGWTIVGGRAGSGYVNSLSYGITATVLGVVMALFFNCLIIMVEQSTNVGFYAGPVEAVVGIFEEMVRYGMFFLHPDAYRVDALLLGGGAVLGVIVEYISRRTS